MAADPVQHGLFNKTRREKILENSPMWKKLNRLNSSLDWEKFRPALEAALDKAPKGPGGRPRYDCILMFKILALKRSFNLSFEETEYQILDRRLFQKFLNLAENENVPDSRTIISFYKTLNESGLIDELFSPINGLLEQVKTAGIKQPQINR